MGVVEFTDADKLLLFQYVGGRFELSEFNNPKRPERFLILIGQSFEKDSITSILRKHICRSKMVEVPKKNIQF